MRRELLPLFGIAALFGSLTTLSVVLAFDPADDLFDFTPSQNDKSLIYTPPGIAPFERVAVGSPYCSQCIAEPAPVTAATRETCDDAECREPVVVELPELLGAGNSTAIDIIKRKLGINHFAGTIYENPPPAPPCASGVCVSDWLGEFQSRPSNPYASSSKTRHITGVGDNADNELIRDIYRGVALDDDDCPGSTPRDVATTSYVTEEPQCIECTVGIEALRDSSEDLDSAANQLERLERYEQADLLRNAAHELRHLARRLRQNGGGTTNVSAAAPMPLGARFDVLSDDAKECTAELPPPVAQ